MVTLVRPFPFVTLSFRTLLLILMGIDVGLIGLNLIAEAAVDGSLISSVPDIIKITTDHALPEDFGYLKWAIITAALLWMAIRDRWIAPALWAVVFVIILADDSLQLHETIGMLVADHFSLPSFKMFSANDIGELVAFMPEGLLALTVALVLYTRPDPAVTVLNLRNCLIVVGVGFFAVGIDALHQTVSHLVQGTSVETLLPKIFALIEESGEMLVSSLGVAMTLASDDIAWFAGENSGVSG